MVNIDREEPLHRGEVVQDRRARLWLCVRSREGNVPALMICEDSRISRPCRQLQNLEFPVTLVAAIVQDPTTVRTPEAKGEARLQVVKQRVNRKKEKRKAIKAQLDEMDDDLNAAIEEMEAIERDIFG